MCLYTDWQNIGEEGKLSYSPDDEMIMEVGIKNRKVMEKYAFQEET